MSTPGEPFDLAVRMGFVLDVAGYSGRSAREKVDVQHRVSTLVREMMRDLGLALAETYHQGTGDGMVVFLPSGVEVHRTLARLLRSASDALADDNRRFRDRMWVRMAFVLGPLAPAPVGFSGNAIVEAGRMVDSQALRDALNEQIGVDLVALISDQLHAYVVRERHSGVAARDFRPVEVHHKEFEGIAWLWLGPDGAASGSTAVSLRFGLVSPNAPNCTVGILPGSIMRVRGVDIWVNSENTDMEMPRYNDFSISSIIRYYGARRDAGGRVVADVIAEELATAVGDLRPVAPGSAFITESGALAQTNDVRWIIHVASVYGEPGAGFRPVRNVGTCVSNVLTEAERLASADPAARTILFPMLGVGVAGGSVRSTATELVGAAVDYLHSTPATLLQAIYFLGYRDTERAALEHALALHPGLRPEQPD